MDTERLDEIHQWNLKGKRATVLGLAREGTALARFLVEQGAHVTVSDLKDTASLQSALAQLSDLPVRYFLGSHPLEILDCDLLFVSPGIPLDAPIVVEARRRGLTLSSETRLFCHLCPAVVIGITGSSGKTTTATLVAKMLEKGGHQVHLGGNIGNPLINKLPWIRPSDLVVMELSSFQLDFFGPRFDAQPHGELASPLFPPGSWSPPIAAVLNVTPNHLDRHPSMEAYIAAKAKIVRYQRPQDYALLNADDAVARGFAADCPGRVAFFSLRDPVPLGAYLKGDDLVLRGEDGEVKVCSVGEIRLRGRHNVANVLAACALAQLCAVPTPAMAEVARTFAGVEHRLEPVCEWRGVWYYNDSIATSPERAMAALRSFAEPIVLLAGGRDKHLPWAEWAELVRQKVVHVILFGEAAALIERELRRLGDQAPPIHHAESLAHAVQLAEQLAQPGQVVLFSPGGTSFDAFRDYAERGETFKRLVHELCREGGAGSGES
ncbi:MAG: UDP-N-acetylmuramoyl-L-alanine--D-glutamate ligase [Chloroflexi bacterium]|nr:UDP-N-acetylmuramoyl-L-alanine--D-glutamate ligase [Chloroflexota bacterium]